jgi:hypothetical protein
MKNSLLVFGCFALVLLLHSIASQWVDQSAGAPGTTAAPPPREEPCDYNRNTRPCFYGSIFFQNCQGELLTAPKPYHRLEWQVVPTSKACFLLRKPLFPIEPQPTPELDEKYYCSIESTRFPGYFLRSDQKGEVILEKATNMAIQHMERNDFIFQIEKGLSGAFQTVTIRPVNPIYGNACFYDDGTGIKFTPKECAVEKRKATFYIGMGLRDYDWWWKRYSLFHYDNINSNYMGNLLGDSLTQSLNPRK